nr:hypothetical protein [Tanacetum cinerariifolium]
PAQKGKPKKNKGNASVGLEENVREGSTGSFRGGAVRGGVVRGSAVRGGSIRVRGEIVRGAISDGFSNLGVKRQILEAKSGTSKTGKTLGIRIKRAIANVIHLTQESQVQGVNDQGDTVRHEASLNEQASGMDQQTHEEGNLVRARPRSERNLVRARPRSERILKKKLSDLSWCWFF